jgi:hypothetical protein
MDRAGSAVSVQTPPGIRITEVKRKLDGTVQRFDCELIARTPSLLVALYRFEDRRGPIDSYGFFWARRPYLCYYLVPRDPQRAPRARFDVIRDMRFGADDVSYTDLILDLWVDDGVLRWEDEDELEAATLSRVVTTLDRAYIDSARGVLTRHHRRIVGEVQRTIELARKRPASTT